MKNIDAITAKKWLSSREAIVIDVRSPIENETVKIDNSILMPVTEIDDNTVVQHDKKIIIYCAKGIRGEVACKKLELIHKDLDLYNLDGGIESWINAELPVIRGGRKMMPISSQVQLFIGSVVFIFSLLAHFVSSYFAFFTALIGMKLIYAGKTGKCELSTILSKMPWNK